MPVGTLGQVTLEDSLAGKARETREWDARVLPVVGRGSSAHWADATTWMHVASIQVTVERDAIDLRNRHCRSATALELLYPPLEGLQPF